MRILVLGGGGQLARDLIPQMSEAGHQVSALDRSQCDITREDEVRDRIRAAAVDRVVNCAGYTNVDGAETHEDQAEAVNHRGAALVARACGDAGVPLCHLSTDFVFGQPPAEHPVPWREVDEPQPHGVYAETKRRGELACLASGARLFLVRTSWLYGNRGPNFPLAILRTAAGGRPLRVVADQVGSPTWTVDLARALTRLLPTDAFGLYHLSGSGSTTWFGFAGALLEEAGVAATVRPVSGDEWGAPAPRPRYSVLENAAWRALGEAPLPPWRDALRRYLASDPEPRSILGRV